jgi:hypothetical protein
MVNENGGKTTSSINIGNNWLDYGTCTVNISQNGLSTPINNIQVTKNKFGNNGAIVSGSKCTVVVDKATKSLAGNIFSDNVWESGALPVPVIRNGE